MKMLMSILSLFTFVEASLHIPETSRMCYTRPGDVLIGLVIGATDPDNELKCSVDVAYVGLQIIETFVYTIEQINNNPEILPNVTLGFVILDACNVMSMFLAQTLYMIPDENPQTSWQVTSCDGEKKTHYKIAALVADYRSRNVIPMALTMSMAHTPIISPGATSDELSDRSRFGYLLRLTPTDEYQADAILQILVTFNWTYFSIIYSEGSYGENGAKNLQKGAITYNLCIEDSFMLFADTGRSDMARTLDDLRRDSVAKAIVLFMEGMYVNLFLDLVGQDMFQQFIWIGSHPVTILTSGSQMDGLLIYIDHDYILDTEVKEHYFNLTPTTNQNPWFLRLWEELYSCSWSVDLQSENANQSCSNPWDSEICESCEDYRNNTLPVNTPYIGVFIKYKDAVDALAHGLHNLISTECPDGQYNTDCVQGEVYLRFIQNISIQGYTGTIEFDENGVTQGRFLIKQFVINDDSRLLGRWVRGADVLDINKNIVDWSSYMGSEGADGVPRSVCSVPCDVRQYYIQKEVECCWECRSCRENEFIINNGTSCTPCDENEWPDDDGALICLPIPPVYLHWTDDVGIIMLTFSLMGIILCTAFGIFFIFQSDSNLIKASRKDLSTMILCGISLAFLSVFIVIAKPEKVTCFLRDLGFSVSVTVIYVPILVKAVRVHLVFTAGKQGKSPTNLVSPRALLIISLGLILIQVVLTSLLGIFQPSHPVTQMPVLTERYTEMMCTLPQEALVVLLTYNLLLLVACATFGFLTRKLPENFNESWFIFVSVATTTFLWLVLLPTYFTTFYAYHKTALLATCLILNAYINLVCLFLPKIYAVIYVDEQKMKFITSTNATTSTGIST